MRRLRQWQHPSFPASVVSEARERQKEGHVKRGVVQAQPRPGRLLPRDPRGGAGQEHQAAGDQGEPEDRPQNQSCQDLGPESQLSHHPSQPQWLRVSELQD